MRPLAARTVSFVALIGLLVVPAALRADVSDATAAGFSLKISTDVSAAAPAVFRALAEQIQLWWEPAHTWSGSAANLSIDPRAGGCFCERLNTGGVQHMTVTYIDRPKQLRLQGGLGPLGSLAVSGAMTWVVTENIGRSHIELTYNVGGYMPGGLNTLAPVVDGVLTTQVRRLKTFIETGRPQ